MTNKNIAKRGWLAALIVVAILVIDQVIKIWVKTHMTLHEQIEIFSWFKIVFIENNGMAYGMEIGSKLSSSMPVPSSTPAILYLSELVTLRS